MKEKEKIKLFEPSDRDMKLEYPELAETEEFVNLSAREMKFVWYYANSTSPISHYSNAKRLEKSISLAYQSFSDRKELDDVKKGKFYPELKDAIKRMESYNISYRLRARMNNEHIFDNLTSMTMKSNSDLEQMEIDDQKKYADLCIKVSKEMIDIIRNIENSGIKKEEIQNKKADVKVSINNIGL